MRRQDQREIRKGKRMIMRKMGIFFLILLAGMLAACSGGAGGKATPTPLPELVSYEKAIFTVERGKIVSEKKVVGDIEPSKQDDLFFRSGGYITRVSVKVGDPVKAGDVLAELQVDDLLNQLQQARIDLEVTQADLAKNKAQHDFDIERAKADVVIKKNQVELAKLNVEQALGLDKTRAQLGLEDAQQELTLAEKALELASTDVNVYLEQAVKRSELAVSRLEGLIAERQIVAPYDGLVLKTSVRAGQQVDGYVSAFTVGDPTDMVIRAVYESDLASHMTPDTVVNLFTSSDAKDGYRVNFLANFVPQRGVENSNQQSSTTDYLYFSLPTDLPEEQLPTGRSVFLTVVLGQKEDALLLPPAAIREYKGLMFVIVQDGDKRRRVEINEVGLKSSEKWEVVADLKVGDQVVGP
jgi:multidrug efflux pump subunit AcrA (membrane-fusion protein)